MKHWNISYAVRNNDTKQIEEKKLMVVAYNVIEAIEEASSQIAASATPRSAPNLDIVIYSVSMIEGYQF